jgi:hypothetical protein
MLLLWPNAFALAMLHRNASGIVQHIPLYSNDLPVWFSGPLFRIIGLAERHFR